MPKEYDVPILVKTIQILDYIQGNADAKFSAICGDLGYAKSTTFQILQTLLKYNMVNKTDAGKYQLGYKFLTWSDAVIKNIDIREISYDILKKLAETVGVSVHLAVKTGPTSSTFIEKIDGALYTIHNTSIGSDIVWQCSACGKVLFAWSSKEEQLQILNNINFLPYTSKSILDGDEFLKNIRLVRKNGYAIDRSEWTENVLGVGVPVFDHKGKMIAAISCAILANDMQDDELKIYVDDLKEASFLITDKFRYTNGVDDK